MKKGKRIVRLFKGIILLIAILMLTGAILHSTYYKGKLEQIIPYGRLVDVNDGQMHVCSMGKGEVTIVLLPGLGIPLPSADFAPLMRKLSEKYTVVCIEYFGTGFSSMTSKPRTCENYVEEIRMALNQAGYKPPYVLMAHSISGVYSEYYSARYPDEISAVISLDGTSTAFYNEMPAIFKSILRIAQFQQAIGVTSMVTPLAVNRNDLISRGYSEKEINDIIVFSGFTINTNLVEQIENSSGFIKQTMNLGFPESVPYFKVISRQTYETTNKQLVKAGLSPQEYQLKHLERIGGHARYEILDGSHFIYLNNVERIAAITDDLLTIDTQRE